MGEFTVAAVILGICVILAVFEITMASRNNQGGATAPDWKRARGIVGIGVVLAALAWLVQWLTSGS
jgi:hypothetical protein